MAKSLGTVADILTALGSRAGKVGDQMNIETMKYATCALSLAEVFNSKPDTINSAGQVVRVSKGAVKMLSDIEQIKANV